MSDPPAVARRRRQADQIEQCGCAYGMYATGGSCHLLLKRVGITLFQFGALSLYLRCEGQHKTPLKVANRWPVHADQSVLVYCFKEGSKISKQVANIDFFLAARAVSIVVTRYRAVIVQRSLEGRVARCRLKSGEGASWYWPCLFGLDRVAVPS